MSKITRSIERELFIGADADRVWQALTEAEELMRWFAPYAESEAGPDGFIRLAWDGTEILNELAIRHWEPGVALQTTWNAGPRGDSRLLPLEIRLERHDGGVLLRLVHSGFLSDSSWDDEFDSHGRGWSYELRSLKYYLETQFGRSRQFLKRRIRLQGSPEKAWQRFIGPDGLFGAATDTLQEGDRFQLRLPTGDLSAAEVLFGLPGTDFACVAEVLQGGLFRFCFETFAGYPEVWVWAFSWQLGQRQLATIVEPILITVSHELESAYTKQETG